MDSVDFEFRIYQYHVRLCAIVRLKNFFAVRFDIVLTCFLLSLSTTRNTIFRQCNRSHKYNKFYCVSNNFRIEIRFFVVRVLVSQLFWDYKMKLIKMEFHFVYHFVWNRVQENIIHLPAIETTVKLTSASLHRFVCFFFPISDWAKFQLL